MNIERGTSERTQVGRNEQGEDRPYENLHENRNKSKGKLERGRGHTGGQSEITSSVLEILSII